MLQYFRKELIETLWQQQLARCPELTKIQKGLASLGITELFLDHFAIIDLPSNHSGIPFLKKIFTLVGFQEQGADYLPDKQNDFAWLTEENCHDLPATSVLPQIVVADFRLDELSPQVKVIIEKYTKFIPPFEQETFQELLNQFSKKTHDVKPKLLTMLLNYLSGREWPLPSVKEYQTVHEENELLSWVLLFGRLPNHFTLSVHLLKQFPELETFLNFISGSLQLPLNLEGGKIKGDRTAGIAQASTLGISQKIELADGSVMAPVSFVEFVWRYSKQENPYLWKDYFTGFLAQHADYVIESLLQ